MHWSRSSSKLEVLLKLVLNWQYNIPEKKLYQNKSSTRTKVVLEKKVSVELK